VKARPSGPPVVEPPACPRRSSALRIRLPTVVPLRTVRTVRILYAVGALFIVLGIVRLIIGVYVFGVIGIILGVAMILRALQASRTAT
jgi:hypothetical protein